VIWSWSWSDMRSRMMRAMRARPMLNWLASNSATERTRRLPKMVDVVGDRRLGPAIGRDLAAGPQQQQVLDDDDEVLAAQRRVIQVGQAEREALAISAAGSRYHAAASG